MPQVLDNIIVAAVPAPKTYSVKVTWANGGATVNRFDHLVGKGVFAAFSDPAVFAQVRVGERRRSLEWPGEITFCADALWFEMHPADGTQQPQRAADQSPQHAAPWFKTMFHSLPLLFRSSARLTGRWSPSGAVDQKSVQRPLYCQSP